MLVCRIRKQQGKLYCKASEWPLWDAKLAKASQPQGIVTNHQAPTALHTLLFCLMAKQVQIRRPSYPLTTWHPSPWFPSEKFSHSTAYLAVLPDGKASANPATLLPSNNMTSVPMVSKWKNFQNIKYYGWLLIVPVPEDLGVVKSFDEVIYSLTTNMAYYINTPCCSITCSVALPAQVSCMMPCLRGGIQQWTSQTRGLQTRGCESASNCKSNRPAQITGTEAEPQQIVAQRLLSCLQYHVPYLSRLQRIWLDHHWKLFFGSLCFNTQCYPGVVLIHDYCYSGNSGQGG